VFERVDFRFRLDGCHAPKSKFDQAAQAIGGNTRIIREQRLAAEGEMADGYSGLERKIDRINRMSRIYMIIEKKSCQS
jgi:hypothetical protein